MLKDQLTNALRDLAKALTVVAQQRMLRELGKTELGETAEVQLHGDSLDLMLADHYIYVEKGRKRGKQPPVSVIVAWIRSKRIVSGSGLSINSLAWAIAKTIARRGLKPRPFLGKVAEDMEAYAAAFVTKFTDDLADQILARLKNDKTT